MKSKEPQERQMGIAFVRWEYENIYQALRKVEEYGFISTIRSGQYFVRKYFTKDYDEKFGQTYDDFEV